MYNADVVEAIYDIFARTGRVSTDSRNVAPGSVFFALKGESFDGNRFAASALEAGAACCVVDDPSAAVDDRYIVVADTLEALQALAREHRKRLGIPILAITGSNGKTTTKELVSRVLSKKYNVTATQGNLNNHIGVPLTILSMNSRTEFGVVEMGANHRGEIALLCSIARPDYGIITNIGRAHLEGFGGIGGIIEGKGELFDYLAENGGTAFYLADSPELTDMVKSRSGLKSEGFSTCGMESVASADNTLTIKVSDPDGGDDIIIKTKLIGDYNRSNIAAALAVARVFDIDMRSAAQAIESYEPDNGRSERRVTARNIVYMDAYNANPSSMKAAIENFAACSEPGFKKLMILGDMRELGEYSIAEHREILSFAEASGAGDVMLVGETFGSVNSNPRHLTFASADDLCDYLGRNPFSARVILVKGSRGARLEKILPLL